MLYPSCYPKSKNYENHPNPAGLSCAHLVGTTKTRPKALPLPARHERGEGRGEGFVYSFDVVPGASFVIRLVVPAKCARLSSGASICALGLIFRLSWFLVTRSSR